MTDQNTPASYHQGGEPTVPLVPSSGYTQPDIPPLEHTAVDPFGTDRGYPDFSLGAGEASPSISATPTYESSPYTSPATDYSGPAASPSPLTRPYIDPEPLPSRSNYSQPTPADQGPYAAGFSSAHGQQVSQPQYAQYQPYPSPAPTPLHDPVAYDYGYARSAQMATDHPNAVISLILGLVGFFFFPILCPVGWALAARGRREVAQYPGRWNPGGTLTAGWIVSMLATLLWGLLVVMIVGIIVIGVAAAQM